MTDKVTGLYSYPWNRVFTEDSDSAKSMVDKYKWAVWFKANPRDQLYMEKLFTDKFPGGQFVNLDEAEFDYSDLNDTGKVILLYPDSIGIGFGGIEKRIAAGLGRNFGHMYALNGRKRLIKLNRTVLLQLKFRRILEVSMISEFCFMLLYILSTPFLIVADSIHKRDE